MVGLVEESEMHQRGYRSSRCRDQSYRAAAARKSVAASDLKRDDRDLESAPSRLRGDGNGQCRSLLPDDSYGSGSSLEDNSVSLEFGRSSFERASGKPIKALIDEEMSRDMGTRRPSPSVIARLMGLDSLPPPQITHGSQKEIPSHLQKKSSAWFRRGNAPDDNHLHRKSDHQEFKDVFEVMDTSMVDKHKNQSFLKGTQCSKKQGTDIGKKFVDTKRLPTDNKTLQNCKEQNAVSEVLDSSEDSYDKCLEKSNSLLANDRHGLRYFSHPPQESHITVLKPLKGIKHDSAEPTSKVVRKTEIYAHRQREVISSFGKYTRNRVSNLKEYDNSHPWKLPEKQYSRKDDSIHPTQIVVLKPSRDKFQGTARNASLPTFPEDLHIGVNRHNGFWSSGVNELHREGTQRHKMFDFEEVVKHNTKGSREIAREVTEQMRRSVSNPKKVSNTGFSQHNKNEPSHSFSHTYSLSNSGRHKHTLENIDGWNNSAHSSSLYSSESSMNREARKQLSERWKISQRCQKMGFAGRDSGILGEMLALSDTETPMPLFQSSVPQKGQKLIDKNSIRDELFQSSVPQKGQKLIDKNSIRDELFARHGYHSRTKSQEGWVDGRTINLPRTVSLSASSIDYGDPKPSRRHSFDGCDDYMSKDVLTFRLNDAVHGNFSRRRLSQRNLKCGSDRFQSFSSGGEAKRLHGREIHVNLEETARLVEHMSLDDSLGAELHWMTNEEKVQPSAGDGDSSYNDQIEVSSSFDRLAEDSLTSHYAGMDSGSSVSSKEADQPSPNSVLELPSEEKSSETCFQRIGADLHELRMQLQLLKLETETYEEESDLLSDDDSRGHCQSIKQIEEGVHQFEDDADRDFSYLIDVLIVSGIRSVNQDRLFDACYLPERPVDPNVFEKLEKKYGVLTDWLKSERKLFFDHVNSALAAILAPCMDLHPWVKSTGTTTWIRKGLAEEVLQMVVGQRKEWSKGNPEGKVLDTKWLEVTDDIDMIGREIERMMTDALLEELVSEFVIS